VQRSGVVNRTGISKFKHSISYVCCAAQPVQQPSTQISPRQTVRTRVEAVSEQSSQLGLDTSQLKETAGTLYSRIQALLRSRRKGM